jgi:hypothetical protein
MMGAALAADNNANGSEGKPPPVPHLDSLDRD